MLPCLNTSSSLRRAPWWREPRVPSDAGGVCRSATRPACDAHWAALTATTLTMTLLSKCGASHVHLACVQSYCAGGCYATWLVGCFSDGASSVSGAG